MSSGDSAGGRTVVLQALHGLPEDAIGEGLEGPEARPLVLAGECELEQPTCERPRGPRCALARSQGRGPGGKSATRASEIRQPPSCERLGILQHKVSLYARESQVRAAAQVGEGAA